MGEQIHITIGELQARTEHYVRKAAEQQRVIITDHGKPVAELQPTTPPTEWVNPWKTRKLRPEFKRLSESGAFAPKPGDRDITELISDDRDGN
jgi:prevent-host-death family protein